MYLCKGTWPDEQVMSFVRQAEVVKFLLAAFDHWDGYKDPAEGPKSTCIVYARDRNVTFRHAAKERYTAGPYDCTWLPLWVVIEWLCYGKRRKVGVEFVQALFAEHGVWFGDSELADWERRMPTWCWDRVKGVFMSRLASMASRRLSSHC